MAVMLLLYYCEKTSLFWVETTIEEVTNLSVVLVIQACQLTRFSHVFTIQAP